MMIWTRLQQAVEADGAAALVSVVKALGSTPREAGARMIVTPWGIIGTIGGGALEFQAITDARRQMATGGRAVILQSQALGPDLGQCCGGRVELAIEAFDESHLADIQALALREVAGPFTLTGRIVAPTFSESFGEDRGKLYLFGAGHVGQALVTALAPLIDAPLTAAPLPLDIVWIDSRPDCLPSSASEHVKLIQSDDPIGKLSEAGPGDFVLIMTHSHALDYDLTEAALRQPGLRFVGLIGSATKRARFTRRLREAGIAPARIADLVCPIGLTTIRSKHPAAIAAAIAADLLVRTEAMQGLLAPDDSVIDASRHLRSHRREPVVTEVGCNDAGACTGCAGHDVTLRRGDRVE
jgi:xanthine dehydrogenase accessory factor